MLEIDALDAFRTWIDDGPERPPAACQALDLTGQPELETQPFPNSLFLSCDLTPAAATNLVHHGALVIHDPGDRPFPMHRPHLYTPEELFDGYDGTIDGYFKTYDYAVYVHYVANGKQFPTSILESLARRLHDHAMTDALTEALEGTKPVAIMGGHGLERRDPVYSQVARIARELTLSGYTMLSGGGPGAMEATHLGAWFAHFPKPELDKALAQLSARPAGGKPGKEYADPDWLKRAMDVRDRWPVPAPRYHSVGIPTWLYGHEPPAPFATQIAKYFANSVREEGLLAVATHGVIFAQGSAGTTQEIFQDACQNHYGSFGSRSPMILLGRDFWTTERPVWPLLQKVAQGRVYDELLFLTDDEQAVVRKIKSYNPEVYAV